jgi:hypothetical protein
MVALIGTGIPLVGAAATTARNADDDDERPRAGPASAASALVGGGIECFESAGRANLRLGIGGGGGVVSGTGGVVGIPAGPGGGASFGVFEQGRSTAGTCADALSALGATLPAPLCATGRAAFGQGFTFACSGRAREVVEAVGDLAKALTRLP